MTGFKNFIMRGNLIELAVAVVIGTQFSNLVKQFVASFVNPLLSLVGGTPNLGKLALNVGKSTFTYGQFLTEALTFLISALVVYYAMVLPASRLLKLFERNQAATTRDCPECTMSIPVAARRCPECTAEVTPAIDQPQPVGRLVRRHRHLCCRLRTTMEQPMRMAPATTAASGQRRRTTWLCLTVPDMPTALVFMSAALSWALTFTSAALAWARALTSAFATSSSTVCPRRSRVCSISSCNSRPVDGSGVVIGASFP